MSLVKVPTEFVSYDLITTVVTYKRVSETLSEDLMRHKEVFNNCNFGGNFHFGF